MPIAWFLSVIDFLNLLSLKRHVEFVIPHSSCANKVPITQDEPIHKELQKHWSCNCFIPIQKQTAHHIQSVPDFHFPSTRLHHLPNPQKSPSTLNLTELRNNRCMQHKPNCPFETLMLTPWKSNIKLLKKFCPQA